jgi:hypothetical protein
MWVPKTLGPGIRGLLPKYQGGTINNVEAMDLEGVEEMAGIPDSEPVDARRFFESPRRARALDKAGILIRTLPGHIAA